MTRKKKSAGFTIDMTDILGSFPGLPTRADGFTSITHSHTARGDKFWVNGCRVRDKKVIAGLAQWFGIDPARRETPKP